MVVLGGRTGGRADPSAKRLSPTSTCCTAKVERGVVQKLGGAALNTYKPLLFPALWVALSITLFRLAPCLPCAEVEKGIVQKLGGLHVVGTERHESRRIDNQLRGRSGRQGDLGSTRYFLSLEVGAVCVLAWIMRGLVQRGRWWFGRGTLGFSAARMVVVWGESGARGLGSTVGLEVRGWTVGVWVGTGGRGDRNGGGVPDGAQRAGRG